MTYSKKSAVIYGERKPMVVWGEMMAMDFFFLQIYIITAYLITAAMCRQHGIK